METELYECDCFTMTIPKGWTVMYEPYDAGNGMMRLVLAVVDPADNAATGVGNYLRIANIGSQQLQARVVTSYYGLSLDFISQNTVLLGSN